ncbi:hypothetical protein F511_26981 [Dorcoceras hygrometricum]|uniref:Uncharacterized protein n=1 Tax=Dorcoceras hygrometricum TaxID=472368 RepID=A0A2Z7AD49_9LAMI|nr:hypothetical protein F511_26981 [Dorcoceras hygrometricum]
MGASTEPRPPAAAPPRNFARETRPRAAPIGAHRRTRRAPQPSASLRPAQQICTQPVGQQARGRRDHRATHDAWMVHASPVDRAIMREGGAPLSAALHGQHATNGRTAASYGRPSRAQQLAQDSLPLHGQQADTASRGPTTIVAPESRFRTCPTDHDSIGYPRMSASGESSTTMHRLLHASGSHPIRRLVTPNTSLELGWPYPHFDGSID